MRRDKVFTATEGRDKGKEYLITEMPASQAEDWAMRALIALDVEPMLLNSGMAGVASVWYRGLYGASYADLKPLLDEMMDCVQRLEEKATRKLVEDDIEDVRTRIQIREEVLDLHVGFSLRAELLRWISARQTQDSSDTPTSAPSSEP